MSDLMLLGALRQPLPDNPSDLDPVAWAQIKDRMREAAERIEAQPSGDPVAWIRWRSDGAYEGPLMHAQMEEVRKQSGAWTPLYGCAQPAPEADAVPVVAVMTSYARSNELNYWAPSSGRLPTGEYNLVTEAGHLAAMEALRRQLKQAQQQAGECSGGYQTLEREAESLRLDLAHAHEAAGANVRDAERLIHELRQENERLKADLAHSHEKRLEAERDSGREAGERAAAEVALRDAQQRISTLERSQLPAGSMPITEEKLSELIQEGFMAGADAGVKLALTEVLDERSAFLKDALFLRRARSAASETDESEG